jgi:hypothetical protein
MPRAARERQTFLNDNGKYVTINLPEMCLIVHMYQTGSGPDLGEDRYMRHLETLQIALDNWEVGREDDRLFDDAVYNLVKATIEESQGIRKV